MAIHLSAQPGDYAPAVLVPGDPHRARYIAENFFDAGARCVNEVRGALGYTGTFRGRPISVQSVGMGCASATIYYTELMQLGAQRLVRVGTAGGIAPQLQMGDTVIAMSATADDPMVLQLTGGEAHAPTATWHLLETAVTAARASGATVHVGPIVSSAIFYEMRDGIMARWRDRGHLAVEMEAAALYTLAAIHSFEAVALMTISDLVDVAHNSAERISDAELRRGVDRMMEVACEVAVADDPR